MRGELYHLEINVSSFKKSFDFYDSFLQRLGYRRIYLHRIAAGWGTGICNFWIIQSEDRFASLGFHRRRVGLNHVAFHAESRGDVDDFYNQYLLPRNVPVLYGGPKDYPEYSKGYYSVYFEDPDRIKMELAHIPEFKQPIA